MKNLDLSHLLLVSLVAGPISSFAIDLSSAFDSDSEQWGVSQVGGDLTWQDSGGFPEGFIQASTPIREPWYFTAPEAWYGDWSAFQLIKFDLKIIDRVYADEEINDILVIAGADGTELVWRGPSPLWQWTRYEVALRPSFFEVDRETFDRVMSQVVSLRILGEYVTGSEREVGLDNVVITESPSPAPNELIATFDEDIEDWRPFDDVTLSWQTLDGEGFLHGDDWADGRIYHFVSPVAWSGDWRAFRMLRFDLIRLTGGGGGESSVVKIVGGNGDILEWTGPAPGVNWTSYDVYLVAENFGVSQDVFDEVMSHVVELRILGEYYTGDESEGLDNVIVTKQGPAVFTKDLISDFDSDLDEWRAVGDGTATWAESGGNPGGYFEGSDQGLGISWFFASPEIWEGDWRNFTYLSFQLKLLSGGYSPGEVGDLVRIRGMNGLELIHANLMPHDSWTHYSIDLTPENFGTDLATFNSVMAFVQEIYIRGELVGGIDREAMDEFGLYVRKPINIPPERSSAFNHDADGWRKLAGIDLVWSETGGSPGGFLQGVNDGGGVWHFVTPESWCGDWRTYRSLQFDLAVLLGSAEDWTDNTFYIEGANGARLGWKGLIPSNDWTHFGVNLTPETFGVTEEEYESVMRNVVDLRIRGEYVTGPDSSGIDNVFLSKSSLEGGGTPLTPFVSIVPTGPTTIEIHVVTQVGFQYQAQSTEDVARGPWADIDGLIRTGNGDVVSFPIEVDPERPHLFFRVKASAPGI